MNSARITGFQYLKNENPLHSYRLVVDVNVHLHLKTTKLPENNTG